MDPSRLLTRSLRDHPQGEAVTRILSAALEAVDPAVAIAQYVQRLDDALILGDISYSLKHIRHIYIAGAGKASAPMAALLAEMLGERLTQGLVIVKDGYAQIFDSTSHPRLEILEASHPIPDARGVDATQKLIALLEKTGPRDLVLCPLSGGGSALLTAPQTGISLSEIQTLTGLLLACGATINETNSLRKHLEQVKGGQLARLAAPAQVVSLILSDVVGNPLDVIASGPTVPDSTTYQDAYQVLTRYDLVEQVPTSILAHLRKGLRDEIPESPKANQDLFSNVVNILIGSNQQAAEAALRKAEEEGFYALLLTTYLEGEASQVGRTLAAIARQVDASGHPIPRPACLIAGGETTVTLHGPGLGGRNQELALGTVQDIAGISQMALVALATDGGDGPTDAAGAVVTGETLARARQSGLEPADFLERNDAYHFFAPLGDLLKPGPTMTNVNDLSFIFAFA